MDYDQNRIEDTVLALLMLTTHNESEYGARAWKGHDWEVMNRLHERGLISDPKSKSKSVQVTKEGLEQGRKLFDEFFAQRPKSSEQSTDD